MATYVARMGRKGHAWKALVENTKQSLEDVSINGGVIYVLYRVFKK